MEEQQSNRERPLSNPEEAPNNRGEPQKSWIEKLTNLFRQPWAIIVAVVSFIAPSIIDKIVDVAFDWAWENGLSPDAVQKVETVFFIAFFAAITFAVYHCQKKGCVPNPANFYKAKNLKFQTIRL